MTASEYRKLLVTARKEQLKLSKSEVERLMASYDAAAERILKNVRALPEGGMERQGAALTLLHSIDAEIKSLASQLGDGIEVGMLTLAQKAADREANIAQLVGAKADDSLFPHLSKTYDFATVQFGRLAADVVQGAASRVYGDGLNLSERLYSLTEDTKKVIGDTIVQGLAEGISAKEMAARLSTHLRDGMQFPETATEKARTVAVRNRAMTIARTEINTAYREASVKATLDPETGGLKSYISGVGWRLSASHKQADECDLYADDDGDDLGPGNYLPENVPVSHPRCLCFVVSLLVALPEEQFVTKAPNVGDVPESDVRRLAEKDEDPVAKRRLAVIEQGE